MNFTQLLRDLPRGDRPEWLEDNLTPREDVAVRGASPGQRILKVAHPERFRAGDVISLGEPRSVGTGKFYYGVEYTKSLNEVAVVASVRDDGRLEIQRSFGVNPAQRVRRGDPVLIIASAAFQPDEDDE